MGSISYRARLALRAVSSRDLAADQIHQSLCSPGQAPCRTFKKKKKEKKVGEDGDGAY